MEISFADRASVSVSIKADELADRNIQPFGSFIYTVYTKEKNSRDSLFSLFTRAENTRAAIIITIVSEKVAQFKPGGGKDLKGTYSRTTIKQHILSQKSLCSDVYPNGYLDNTLV